MNARFSLARATAPWLVAVLLVGCEKSTPEAATLFEQEHGITLGHASHDAGVVDMWLADLDRDGVEDVLAFQTVDQMNSQGDDPANKENANPAYFLDRLVVAYALAKGERLNVQTNVYSVRPATPSVRRDLKVAWTGERSLVTIVDDLGMRMYFVDPTYTDPWTLVHSPPPVTAERR